MFPGIFVQTGKHCQGPLLVEVQRTWDDHEKIPMEGKGRCSNRKPVPWNMNALSEMSRYLLRVIKRRSEGLQYPQ